MSEALHAEPTGARGRILVIEDNSDDLQYIVRVLRSHGYAPHAATEGRFALSFVKETLPDLILLDVHLPKMNGYEVCRRLKADPRARDVPVMFMSAENSAPDRLRAFSEGAVDYISKPFQEDEALARIDTHLSLRRLAARLIEAKEHAEHASLAKSQFLANMSHELRTPLNAILGFAQILQMSTNLDSRQVRGVDAIRQAGEHLLRLINDILDLARIEADRLELMPSQSSVSAILRFVADVIGVRAEEKGLLFLCETEGELPATVLVDEKRLSQVLLNLLGNAVKFTSQGRVVLRVQRRPGEGNRDGAVLQFSVQDTGAGIAGGDLEKIFQPFEQVGGLNQRAAGVGLGLAISRRLVQLMGSEIHVQSELGAGSRFWFELRIPLALPEVKPVQAAVPDVSGYEGPRRTVLVADDVAANRDVAAGVLGMAGFRTLVASNGRQALEQVREAAPDLILMDVLMPEMDGLAAIRALRRDPTFKSIPVIAVSASNYQADRSKALEAGADAFLPKPLDLSMLFAEIGSMLRLKWTRAP